MGKYTVLVGRNKHPRSRCRRASGLKFSALVQHLKKTAHEIAIGALHTMRPNYKLNMCICWNSAVVNHHIVVLLIEATRDRISWELAEIGRTSATSEFPFH